MNNPIKYDVFISCKSEDYHYAVPIYHFLTTNGLSVFLADVELRAKGRDVYGEIIDAALESAEHLIVFASKAEYVESTYVKSEWRTFVEEKRSGRKEGNIITILKGVQIANLPIALRSFQSFKYAEYKDSLAYLQVSGVKPEPMPAPAPKPKSSLKWVWTLATIVVCGIIWMLFLNNRSQTFRQMFLGDNNTPYVEETLPVAVENEPIEEISTDSNLTDNSSETIVADIGQNRTYQVGDYYNENGKEGVVFEVSEDGLHGKIVSFTQTTLPWCNRENLAKLNEVGAVSEEDGRINTDKIMSRPDSRDYDAFNWCNSLGQEWYLPAINELELLLCDETVQQVVNQKLEEHNATKIFLNRDIEPNVVYYWSSTETDQIQARTIVDYRSVQKGMTYKNQHGAVRAISTF